MIGPDGVNLGQVNLPVMKPMIKTDMKKRKIQVVRERKIIIFKGIGR